VNYESGVLSSGRFVKQKNQENQIRHPPARTLQEQNRKGQATPEKNKIKIVSAP